MEVVNKLFDSTDLYEILNISQDKVTDEKALKSAYLRAALKYHPDKGSEEEREIRTHKFQVIKQIYELFQDEDLRKSYDETGEWPDNEEMVIETSSFGRLDEQTILDFKKTYIGSDEERDDVKRLYKEGKGDIFHVLDNLFFANILDDEKRVQDIIEDLIDSGDMDKLGKGVDKKARDKKIKQAKKEAKEAEEMRKELKIDGSLDALKNALAKNATKRGDFLDELEKKYGGGTEKNGKGPAPGVKKGRGRPAKFVPVQQSDDDEDDEEEDEAPKPKKRKSEPAPVSASSSAAKRGRGRPPKNSTKH